MKLTNLFQRVILALHEEGIDHDSILSVHISTLPHIRPSVCLRDDVDLPVDATPTDLGDDGLHWAWVRDGVGFWTTIEHEAQRVLDDHDEISTLRKLLRDAAICPDCEGKGYVFKDRWINGGPRREKWRCKRCRHTGWLSEAARVFLEERDDP